MQIHTDIPIKHYSQFERHEGVILDNSVIMEYKKCPRSYFFRYVLGYDSAETPPYFAFGSAYHKFREVLELAFNECIEKGFDKQTSCALSLGKATNAAIAYWTKNGPKSYAEKDKFAFLTLDRLKQSIQIAYKWWETEKLAGNLKVLFTEQPFVIKLGTDMNGIDIYLGGRFDQAIETYGKLYNRDFKTSSQPEMFYTRSLKPNNQFALYTFALSCLSGKQAAGAMIETLFNQKTTAPKLKVFPVSYVREEIEEWRQDTIHWVTLINRSRENDHYPANEKQCGFCQFHQVCKMPTEMSRMSILKSQYRVNIWNHQQVDQEGEK